MGKSTGGGGQLIVNGVTIPYNTVEPSVSKTHDDSSDSANYDIGSGLVHLAQLAVSTQTTFSVEGKYDPAIMGTGLLAYLYTNPGSVPCSFRLNLTQPYGHGNVDITEFKTTGDPLKTLTFTCTLISNGVFVANA
jgi:hypothetical protein